MPIKLSKRKLHYYHSLNAIMCQNGRDVRRDYECLHQLLRQLIVINSSFRMSEILPPHAGFILKKIRMKSKSKLQLVKCLYTF